MKRLPRIGTRVQRKPPSQEVNGLYDHDASVGRVVSHYANGEEVDVLWENETRPWAIGISEIQYAKKASNQCMSKFVKATMVAGSAPISIASDNIVYVEACGQMSMIQPANSPHKIMCVESADTILAQIGGDIRPPAPAESQDELIKAYRALAEAVYNSPPYSSSNGETHIPNDTWNRIWLACARVNDMEDIDQYESDAQPELQMIHDDWDCPWYAESQKWRIVEPKLKALLAEIHNYKTDDCVPPQIEEAYDELVSALEEKASNP